MYKLLIIFLFTLISLQNDLCGQILIWETSLTYTTGSLFNKSQQTSDGGFITIGEIRIGNITKLFFVKFNNFGDTLWSKYFDLNLSGHFRGYWIEETKDRGFIIAGSGEGTNSDAYLIKTDSIGNIIWYKTFGGNGLDQGKCVKQTLDNGFILQCRTTSFSSNNDMLLVKTDSLGNMQWQKLFAYKNSISPAGIDLFDSSGYVLGSTIYQIGLWARVKVIRINLKGDILWENEYNYNGMTSVAYSIIFSSRNTIVITGDVTYANLSQVLNIDSLGNLIWQKTYSYQGLYESGRFISESPERGYVFCSRAENSVSGIRVGSLRLIDYDGNIIFQRVRDFGNNEVEYKSVSSTADGGFIISGYISTSNNYYGYELKTDSSGNLKPTSVINNLFQIPEYFLHQNYPNPFNSKTIISFEIKNTSDVIIEIFDLLGRKISTENFYNLQIGIHNYNFEANSYNLSSGIYYYKFNVKSEIDQFQSIRKMLYLK